MRKVIVVFFSLLICFVSYGQGKKKAKPGYYYDLTGEKIHGDLFFEPPLMTSTFDPAHKDGKLREGRLIVYKDKKKVGSLKANEIQSFVIGEDSIVILKKRNDESLIFGKVFEQGELNLYFVDIIYQNYKESYQAVKPGQARTPTTKTISGEWVFKKGEEEYVQSFKLRKEGREAFAAAVSDNKELFSEVMNSKRMELARNIVDIVKRYNSWYESKEE